MPNGFIDVGFDAPELDQAGGGGSRWDAEADAVRKAMFAEYQTTGEFDYCWNSPGDL